MPGGDKSQDQKSIQIFAPPSDKEAVVFPETQEIDYEAAVIKAEKNIETLKKVITIAVKITNLRDWVDQNGSPYLMGSGAEKIRGLFGVSIFDVSCTKIVAHDDLGDYYYFVYKGKAMLKAGVYIEAIGTCSSRDKFFAYEGGELRPDSEVDETNIMKSAYTNLTTNLITRLLGLRNLSWEQLVAGGISKENVQRIEYRSGKINAEQQTILGNIILELVDGNKDKAKELLEKLSSFDGKEGKVRGKRELKDISEKQYKYVLDDAQKALAEKKKASPPKETPKASTGASPASTAPAGGQSTPPATTPAGQKQPEQNRLV